MRTAGSIFAVALVAALGACQQNQGAARSPRAAASAASCPLAQLQGIHAAVADIPNGVAITFTGPSGQVEQLQESVHAMAEANERRGDAFAACPCSVARQSPGAAERMAPEFRERGSESWDARTPRTEYPVVPKPLADARVEDISTGAVLRLSAQDTSQAQALRADTRANVNALRKYCLSPSS